MQFQKKKIGTAYEEAAACWLEQQGMQVMEKNFRCSQGEIDLIGRHQGCLVFIEVKYRRSRDYGFPAEAVTAAKQKKIRAAARYYLYRHGLWDKVQVRFDVVAVYGTEIQWYQNAFV